MFKKTFKINDMAQLLTHRYKTLNEQDVEDIIKLFCKHVVDEMFEGREVEIKNFGTFCNKVKKETRTRNYLKQWRDKPEMIVPHFKTARKLRNYINQKTKEKQS